jgi:hypothetical protein
MTNRILKVGTLLTAVVLVTAGFTVPGPRTFDAPLATVNGPSTIVSGCPGYFNLVGGTATSWSVSSGTFVLVSSTSTTATVDGAIPRGGFVTANLSGGGTAYKAVTVVQNPNPGVCDS